MVFAWHRGSAVSAGEFEAAAHSLAARLPRKPYVVNLCEDRYAFTVAFAAGADRRADHAPAAKPRAASGARLLRGS